ncbi:hypothetical protein LTR85_009676 [Meristemomyces frigidus]|nr:hypothetical protein LTR85_009676 [Meristemomyces frigidus]
MAAAQKVFDIYELHESIILYLPMRDILSAKAVAKAWRSLIMRSLRVRRALFLEPITGQYLTIDMAAASRTHPAGHKPRLIPPLLNTAFSINPAFKDSDTTSDSKSVRPLSYSITAPDEETIQSQGPGSYRCRTYVFEWNVDPCNDAKRFNDAGVMQTMHLTQPPCTAVFLWDTRRIGASPHYVMAVLREDSGVTLGMIKDTYDRMMLRSYDCRNDVNRPCRLKFAFEVDFEAEETSTE